MESHRLQAFKNVYQSQSLLKAAKSLSVTSSAISQSIKQLEKSLGVQLFLRLGKRYQPTQEAHRLASEIVPLYQKINESLESIRKAPKALSGVLRLGTVPEFGLREGLVIVKKFQQAFPLVEVAVHFRSTTHLLKMIQSNEVDMAFVDSGVHVENLSDRISFKPCTDEVLSMACSKGFFKKNGLEFPLNKKSLIGLPHVSYHPGEDGVTKWYRFHFESVPSYASILYADNARGIYRGIELGFGIGVLPYRMIEKDVDLGRFVLLDPKGRPFTSYIAYAQLLSRVPSQLEKNFSEFVLTHLKATKLERAN